MRRTNSMENAVDILPDIAPPLPQAPAPGPARSIPSSEFLSPSSYSTCGPRSTSTSSLFSPRSAISDEFQFLNVESPGIRLASSNSDIFYLPTEVWSDEENMNTVMVTSNIPFEMDENEDLPTNSVESVEQECASSASSSSLVHQDVGLMESVSHPDLTSNILEGPKAHVSHQRSLSADAMSSVGTAQIILPEANHSSLKDSVFDGEVDEGVGSTSESPDVMDVMSSLPRDSLAFKLMNEAGLGTSMLNEENTKGNPFDPDTEDEEEDTLGNVSADAISMDRVFEALDRSVGGRSTVSTDLPSISEENEDMNTLSRVKTSCRNRPPPLSELENLHVSEESIPEPEELAPGTAYTSSLNNLEYVYDESRIYSPTVAARPIHTRAVSDNYVDYALRPAIELDEMISSSEFAEDQDQEPKIRSNAGRSHLLGNRCQSQMIFNNESHEAAKDHRIQMSDRSLSNSDPTLNVDKEDGTDTPCSSTAQKSQPSSASSQSSKEPPPVVLTRKNSTVQPNSWRGLFSAQGAIPHNVVTPTTAGLMGPRSRSSSRSQTQVVGDSSADKPRIEKGKKTGSDTFSFGNFFSTGKGGKRGKKERPVVDETTFKGYEGLQHSGRSMPILRPQRERPTIIDGLPDNISRVFSPTHNGEEEVAVFEKTDFITSLRENPKWSRYSLFSVNEYGSWREKYRHDQLTSKAVSKQDAIFELIMIEKQHCENLVFLQEGYRARLLAADILTEAEVNALIPDVLGALLVFHCNLLEQLMVRQKEKDEVDTISDIIAREFSDDGQFSTICIDAYTNFGAMKDSTERQYNQLLHKNSKFAEFMKRVYQEKVYRKYEFKSVMTRVIKRPTTYGLLMDNIAKFEGGKLTPAGNLTEIASKATKRFAGRIDNNLSMDQMAKKWADVRHLLDHTSHTVMYYTDAKIESDPIRIVFSFEDVNWGVREGGRRLICLGEVNWKVTGLSQKPVFLVLFDDILVILTKKNGRYIFAADQSVLPVTSLMLRVGGRGQSAMVLSKSLKPVLYELEFGSKSDMAKWVTSIEGIIHGQSSKVRLSPRCQEQLVKQLDEYRKGKEIQYLFEENEWNRKLDSMFGNRNQKEDVLSEYFTDRAKFYEDLREHMAAFPSRGRPEVGDRVREAVRMKLRELRTTRSVAFNKLLDDTDRAREVELWSYFNDRADLGEASLGDSDGSGSDSSASGRKPRRIKTFSGAPSSSNTKTNIRRHTTVPRMSTSDACETGDGEETAMNSLEEKEEDQVVEQQVHRLSLRQPLASRRECGELIRDVEKLKKENIKLRNDSALDKLRIATLEKTRGALASDSLSAHSDTMEALRNKEKEVREEDARRRREFENWEAHLVEMQKTIDSERAQFESERSRSQNELQLKWEAFRAAERRRTEDSTGEQNRIPMNNVPTPTRTTFIEARTSTSSQVIPLNLSSETKKRHK